MFQWSPDYCLQMPARRFFSMLEVGREIDVSRRASEHVAQCDIAAIAIGDVKYFNEIRKVFKDRALGDSGRKSNALDPTDPKTIRLLEDMTLQASKFY